ncbi:hypothetical protein V6N13_043550 [Hibiscus sabdariffa]
MPSSSNILEDPRLPKKMCRRDEVPHNMRNVFLAFPIPSNPKPLAQMEFYPLLISTPGCSKSCLATFLYSNLEYRKRSALWYYLRTLHSQVMKPWMIIGDFLVVAKVARARFTLAVESWNMNVFDSLNKQK